MKLYPIVYLSYDLLHIILCVFNIKNKIEKKNRTSVLFVMKNKLIYLVRKAYVEFGTDKHKFYNSSGRLLCFDIYNNK